MKFSVTMLATAGILSIWLPTIGSSPVQKRNNCTFSSDPNCLPYYNDFASVNHYDEFPSITNMTSSNGIYYSGFKVIRMGEQKTKNHLLPASAPNFLRARDASTGNGTQINSEGTIMKFNSFFWGCDSLNDPQPVSCRLEITGYDPVGDPWLKVNSLVLEYDDTQATKNGSGTSLQWVGPDTLKALTLAYLFVFETRAMEEGVTPRLVLDDVDAVYYRQM